MFKQVPLLKQTLRSAQLCLLAAVVGCGPDGNNAKDNTLSGPVKGVISESGSLVAAPVTSIGATAELGGSSAGDVGAYQAVVASAADGRAVTVVWLQSDGTRNNLFARRYSSGAWGPLESLESGSGTVGQQFKVLIDSNNVVTVVWSQASASGGSTDDVLMTRYNGTLWSAPAVIDNAAGLIGALNAIVDTGNNITVTWGQQTANYHLYGRRCDANGNCGAVGTIAQLDDNTQHDVDSPQLALDTTNNVVTVLWRQKDSTDARFDVYANRYAGAWSGFTKLSSGAGGDAQGETMAVDGAGNVTVAWRQYDGAAYFNLWYARFTFGGAWAAAATLEVSNGDVSNPTIKLGAANKAFVFWTQYNGTANDLWAREVAPVLQAAVALDSQTTSAGLAEVAADSTGTLTAVWPQSSGSGTKDDLWVSRKTNAGSWDVPTKLSQSSPAGEATNPYALVDSAGNVTVYWLQQVNATGQIDLWANRYLVASSAWQGRTAVEDLSDSGVTSPISVMAAATRKITLLWQQSDSTGVQHLLVNHHDTFSWLGVRRVDGRYNRPNGSGSVDPNSGGSASMVIDSSGVITVFWLQQINETDGSGQSVNMKYLLANRISF
ncbi:MAG: hypothetical protein HY272_04095 [Gammaproteobacteria bacterium]|nr:hypothetical protein [Gammaproteobacteria bacterium]